MIARTPAKPTRASTQLDPEVEKWLDKHAIATDKSDMNLVVTEQSHIRNNATACDVTQSCA